MSPEMQFRDTIWAAAGGAPGALAGFEGEGSLSAAFPVSGLAAGAVAASGLALAELIGAVTGRTPEVRVDRRLCSLWFGRSIRPDGWTIPPPWDPIAGDYATSDGWIRLHTNAPHHRRAALRVLGAAEDKASVAAAVAAWRADELEAAVVAAGGCAAAMRSLDAWAEHPQGRAVAAEALVWRELHPAATGPLAIDAARPLAGIRVLDLTRVLAGPVSTRFLAGFGAEVLRLDPPGWEEPAVVPDLTLGKSCARLDLRDAASRERFCALLAEADVIVHGYRPGALEGLGFGAEIRRALRPGLVDVCLDAYGWTGPWAGRRGFDSLVQMSAGIAEAGMRRFGKGQPTPLPVQALDHATGYVMAACVVRGLTERLRSGAGSRARTSLARVAALLASVAAVDGPPLAPETEADFAPEVEATAWGPARRLRPPLAIEGAPMRWDRPAGALGSAIPGWLIPPADRAGRSGAEPAHPR